MQILYYIVFGFFGVLGTYFVDPSADSDWKISLTSFVEIHDRYVCNYDPQVNLDLFFNILGRRHKYYVNVLSIGVAAANESYFPVQIRFNCIRIHRFSFIFEYLLRMDR